MKKPSRDDTKPPRQAAPLKRAAVVSFCLRRPTAKSAAANFSPSELIEVVQKGLPVRELEELQTSLALPMEKLGPLLGISKATFHRRKAAGKFDAAESDRIVRFARIMGKAVEVLESEENARRWLTSPQFGLGGVIPLDYAGTEVGAREVEDLLGRIEYGVYS
jgi:putative toxin-antitoxin system antitoxin component (TIGR02293 family)